MRRPKSPLSGLIKILDDQVRAQLDKEMIGGASISSVLQAVDLDIEFSPVVCHPVGRYLHYIPRPTEIKKWADGRYAIVVTGRSPDFEVIPEEAIRVMRARFLLLRDAYYKCLALEQLRDSLKKTVVSLYFNGQIFIPEAIKEKYRAEQNQSKKPK